MPSTSGIGTIEANAFAGCSSLPRVTIGANITGIAYEAFRGCNNLTSVDILGDVTIIGASAFSGCSKLTSINLPETVYDIGFDAFAGCSASLFNEYDSCKYLGNDVSPYYFLIGTTDNNLGSYQIHEDTRVIAYSAFSSCQRLRSIVIPKNVITICYNAFSYTVTSVVFEDTVGWTAIAYYSNDTTFAIDPSILSDSSNAANYLHRYSEYMWRKI